MRRAGRMFRRQEGVLGSRISVSKFDERPG